MLLLCNDGDDYHYYYYYYCGIDWNEMRWARARGSQWSSRDVINMQMSSNQKACIMHNSLKMKTAVINNGMVIEY